MSFVDSIEGLNLETRCHNCEAQINRKEAIFINSVPFCKKCRSELRRCSRCGDLHKVDELESLNGNLYCSDCWELEFRENIVKSYNWEPDAFEPIEGDAKIGSEIEIEVPDGSDRRSLAVKLYRWLKEKDIHNLFYFKHDGSLNNGFEIVSMPIAFNAWRSLPLKDFFDYTVSVGGRAHDTNTCGLHMHIDRDYIPDENIIRKCLFFLSNNKEDVLQFTRRNPRRMNQYATIDRWSLDDVSRRRSIDMGNKYTAINVQHRFSYEFRIYRGTLKYKSYMSCLEFTKLLPDFAKGHSADDMEWNKFAMYSRNNSEYLYEYLNSRDII